ncbi:Rpn family recombination-promoting nuclease/putative transposase, partial [Lachnoclostridium sp. An118]|uniref:Rpn family recombination-promoting nuclease/putative transposase n=1 Tax=Lachnoclostridium sp. An118 TaxID=1965547 RepID=UPI00117B2D56
MYRTADAAHLSIRSLISRHDPTIAQLNRAGDEGRASDIRTGYAKKTDVSSFLHSFTGKEKTVTKKNDNFIMLPTVDVCFKGLMYNPKVRKGFIAALLGADPAAVRETVLLPTALRQEYPDEKLGILDVRTLMEDGAQINMEMQAYPFGEWDARSLFYLSKMYAEQIGRGDPYTKLKKCIHVSILDFIRFADDEKCHRTIRLCDEQTGK